MAERVAFVALYPTKEERVTNGSGLGLVVGTQTRATGYIVDFETELADVADTPEADITGQLSHANGTYVSILGETLTAWGGTGSPHVGGRDRYTRVLISVDEAFATAEEQAIEEIIDTGAFGSEQ